MHFLFMSEVFLFSSLWKIVNITSYFIVICQAKLA